MACKVRMLPIILHFAPPTQITVVHGNSDERCGSYSRACAEIKFWPLGAAAIIGGGGEHHHQQARRAQKRVFAAFVISNQVGKCANCEGHLPVPRCQPWWIRLLLKLNHDHSAARPSQISWTKQELERRCPPPVAFCFLFFSFFFSPPRWQMWSWIFSH